MAGERFCVVMPITAKRHSGHACSTVAARAISHRLRRLNHQRARHAAAPARRRQEDR
jgi:hypothetical protein